MNDIPYYAATKSEWRCGCGSSKYICYFRGDIEVVCDAGTGLEIDVQLVGVPKSSPSYCYYCAICRAKIRKPRNANQTHWGVTYGNKEEIIALYTCGHTLQEIGNKYGVTREAIRQRLREWGVDKADGGSTKRAQIRKLARMQIQEERCMERWGQTFEEHANTSEHLCRLYCTTENNRKRRGKEWSLLFSDWLVLWEGKMDRHPAWWLTRIDDNGPWSKENVHVVPAKDVTDKRDARKREAASEAVLVPEREL